MKSSKLHAIGSRAICALHKQVLSDMKTFLQCLLPWTGERKEL
jgi:hypothetical protein